MFQGTPEGEWEEGTVDGRAGKVNSKYDGYYNIRMNNSSEEIRVLDMKNVNEWKKVEDFSTSRSEEAFLAMVPKENIGSKAVVEARLKQLEEWKKFDVYDEVEDVGQERILGGWVDVYKEVNGKTGVKSRFVARDYMEQNDIQSDSPTVSKTSIRLACAIAASNGWKMETKDYRSAFLQGEPLERELYIEPPLEEKKVGVIWKLKKAVYGLNDAARKWWVKCSHELEELGCVKSIYDPSLFLYYDGAGKLSGLVCLHVDDELGCGGSKDFMLNVWDKIEERLVVGSTEKGDVFKYVGLNITQLNGEISLDQQRYIDSIKAITSDEFEKFGDNQEDENLLNEIGQSFFKAKVGALNWLSTQTRPDISYDVMEFSTCYNKVTFRNLKDLNKCIKRIKQEDVKILFPKLDMNIEEWKLIIYGDGAFANLPDKTSSGGGHTVFCAMEEADHVR